MTSVLADDRKQLVRDAYAAYSTGDRSFYEDRLAGDFTFSAPPDPQLDRDGYFVRCWRGAGRENAFEIVRLIEHGDEVIATYETETSSGVRGRNTEVFTFDNNDRIARIEVYFGWNID
jgi:ketosteroid isomerase-like protein